MVKTVLAALVLGAAGFAMAPAASANAVVVVNGTSYWQAHHSHRWLAAQSGRHVYYDGAYANVSRDNGATIVHAYPGVDVFVGANGGVSVNIGY